MFKDIVCPISAERVDSRISRLTVFLNAVLMILFVFSLQPVLLYLVTLDYGVRAFGYNNYSPLCMISSFIIKLFNAPKKMVDKAPKMFASRLGFICALLGTIFISLGMTMASISIITFFILLAIMDSVFNYCVGCMIYHHFVFPFYKNENA